MLSASCQANTANRTILPAYLAPILVLIERRKCHRFVRGSNVPSTSYQLLNILLTLAVSNFCYRSNESGHKGSYIVVIKLVFHRTIVIPTIVLIKLFTIVSCVLELISD